MDKHIMMVQDFHDKLSVSATRPWNEAPLPDLGDIAEELHDIAEWLESKIKRGEKDQRWVDCQLMVEEVSEAVHALSVGDEIGFLDALADTAYIIFGRARTYNLPLREAFEEVHRSNMTKEKQPDDAAKERVRVKGPNYSPPDLKKVLADYRDQFCPECPHPKCGRPCEDPSPQSL